MSDTAIDRSLNAVLAFAAFLLLIFLAQPGVVFGSGPSVIIGPTGNLSVVVTPPSTGPTTIISPSGNLTHILPSPTPGGIGTIIYSDGSIGFLVPPPLPIPVPFPTAVDPW